MNKYGTNEEERKAIRLIGKGKGVQYIKLPYEENDPFNSLNNVPLPYLAYELYTNGVKVNEISSKLGKSKNTIYKYISNQKKNLQEK